MNKNKKYELYEAAKTNQPFLWKTNYRTHLNNSSCEFFEPKKNELSSMTYIAFHVHQIGHITYFPYDLNKSQKLVQRNNLMRDGIERNSTRDTAKVKALTYAYDDGKPKLGTFTIETKRQCGHVSVCMCVYVKKMDKK